MTVAEPEPRKTGFYESCLADGGSFVQFRGWWLPAAALAPLRDERLDGPGDLLRRGHERQVAGEVFGVVAERGLGVREPDVIPAAVLAPLDDHGGPVALAVVQKSSRSPPMRKLPPRGSSQSLPMSPMTMPAASTVAATAAM